MKYREFTTFRGTKVLAGKSAKQNESLVKEFIGKPNIIMHTARPGSPFCVIPRKAKIGDKKQVAIFCASKSQDWRDNKQDVLMHVFKGKDVYKEKHMKTGTFGVNKLKRIKIKKREIEKFLEKHDRKTSTS
ncbi:MAG: NFACT RNA binding domain-containing protein [Candidatus Nanoarchaeia archaeon]